VDPIVFRYLRGIHGMDFHCSFLFQVDKIHGFTQAPEFAGQKVNQSK